MRAILHAIAHRLGCNEGRIVFAHSADHERCGVAFRCDVCGELSGAHWSVSHSGWTLPPWAGLPISAALVAEMVWTDGA